MNQLSRNLGRYLTRCPVALAVLPMIFWPSFARMNCCCSELARQTEQVISQLAGPGSATDSTMLNSPSSLLESARAGCPRCHSAAASSECQEVDQADAECLVIQSLCDCFLIHNVTTLSPRSEAASGDGRSFLAVACFGSHDDLFVRGGYSPGLRGLKPAPLLFLSANQRRAQLCCWLN